MRSLLTIITICVIAIASVAQNIEVATETYAIGDSIIYQVAYKIKNNNKESIWIWFDKENSQSGLSGEDKARKHFMKRMNPRRPDTIVSRCQNSGPLEDNRSNTEPIQAYACFL